MNFLSGLKYISLGCIAGTCLQVLVCSKVETRYKNRREELINLTMLYRNEKTPVKPIAIVKKEQELIFPFLLNWYTEHMISLGFLFLKISVSKEKVVAKKLRELKEKIHNIFHTKEHKSLETKDKIINRD